MTKACCRLQQEGLHGAEESMSADTEKASGPQHKALGTLSYSERSERAGGQHGDSGNGSEVRMRLGVFRAAFVGVLERALRHSL